MINLEFARPHRSIVSIPNVTLPDFAVVTGVNGSGKTHLLEAIQNGAITVDGVPPTGGAIKLFNFNTLVSRENTNVEMNQIIYPRENLLNHVSQSLTDARNRFLKFVGRKSLSFLSKDTVEKLLNLSQEEFNTRRPSSSLSAPPAGPDPWNQFRSGVFSFENEIQNTFKNANDVERVVVERARVLGIHVSSLTREELYSCVPPGAGLNANVFNQDITSELVRYYRVWEDNRRRTFYNSTYGEANCVQSQTEFETQFGEPPWIFVNRVLAEIGSTYTVNHPTGRGDSTFRAEFIDFETKVLVHFNDLSSGEQIVIAIALCMYNADTRGLTIPLLLLFDEIDALFHPSLTRQVLNVVLRILVREKGVKVMLTTHSPATVALVPADSLFKLSKDPHSLQNCTRDEAVQALTAGYVSVTDNTRFVLTEAQADKSFYTAIAARLVEQGSIPSNPNLVFIPASKNGSKDGGSSVVKEWSTKLPSAGLTSILGLIDRDAASQPSSTVKVLKRYSIENYFLDPLLAYAVLLDHGHHSQVFDAGITKRDYQQLAKLGDDELQQIVDAICRRVESQNVSLRTVHTGMFNVRYSCGKTVRLPMWFRDRRGHDLVIDFRETFKGLCGGKCVITADECRELVIMITVRMPEFIPDDLTDVFRSLQMA